MYDRLIRFSCGVSTVAKRLLVKTLLIKTLWRKALKQLFSSPPSSVNHSLKQQPLTPVKRQRTAGFLATISAILALVFFSTSLSANPTFTLTSPATDADGNYTVTIAPFTVPPSMNRYSMRMIFSTRMNNSGSWTTIGSGTAPIAAAADGSTINRTGQAEGLHNYRLQIQLIDENGNTQDSTAIYTATEVVSPPPVPSSVSISPSSTINGSHTVSWPAASRATKYVLQQKKGSGSWVQKYSGSSRSRSYSALAVASYRYRVKACIAADDQDACSGWRTSGTASIVAPARPASISTPGTNYSGSYTVSWTAVSGVTKYQLQQRVGSGSWVTQVNGNRRSKALSNLPVGSYTYRVRACYTSGSYNNCSSWRTSSAVQVKTPSAPDGLTAPANNTTSSYQVSWNSSSGAIRYELHRRLSGDSWSRIQNNSSRSITESALPNGIYQYRVRACSAVGCSGYSGVVQTVQDFAGFRPPLTNDDTGLESALGSTFHGRLSGEAGVTPSGAAEYHLPIALPSATREMKPSLALSYNSQGGNGHLGVGWSLSGLSAISRCGATHAIDGFKVGVTYTADDRYCLNGERLIAISGQPGDNATQYRTEQDSYATITSHGSYGSGSGVKPGPRYFTVEYKNGLIETYGSTTNSRLSNRKGHRYWALVRSEDPYGNAWRVVYDKQDEDEQWPTHIHYTENTLLGLSSYATVEFNYATDRAAVTEVMLEGSQTYRRYLTMIETRVDNQRQREYRLSYNTSASSQHLRLAAIDHCNGTGQCMGPLSIAWQATPDNTGMSAAITASSKKVIASHQDNPRHALDLNGDGKAELHESIREKLPILHADFDGDGQLDTLRQGIGEVRQSRNPDIPPHVLYYPYELLGSAGERRQIWPWSSPQNKSKNPNGVAMGVNWLQGQVLRPSDYNGDGRADLRIRNTEDKQLVTLLADDRGRFTSDPIQSLSLLYTATASGHVSSRSHTAGDFNGDGLMDAVFYEGSGRTGIAGKFYMSHTDKTGALTGSWQLNKIPDGSITGAFSKITGDFNGDGRTDIFIQQKKAESKAILLIANSEGDFNHTVIPANHLGLSWGRDAHTLITGDFNGDGRTDLFLQGVSSGRSHAIVLSDSQGHLNRKVQSWSGSQWGYHWHQHDSENTTHYLLRSVRTVQAADTDGDGRDELIMNQRRSTDGKITFTTVVWKLYPGKNLHDRVASVTDNLGVEIRYAYAPLTDTNVHIKGAYTQWPKQPLVTSQYVVKRFTNGLGHRLDYRYQDKRVNVNGRGDLGFKQISVTDRERGTNILTEYYQGYPRNGRAKFSEIRRVSDNRLLSRSDYQYRNAAHPQDNKVRQVYLRQMAEYRYALSDGRRLSTSVTENTQDAHGNLSEQVITVTDSASGKQRGSITRHFYDSSQRFYGRVTRTQIKVTEDGVEQPTLTRTTAFTYNSQHQVETQTQEPGKGAPLEHTKRLTYDSFGNILTEQVSGPKIASRTHQTFVWDTRGRHTLEKRNAQNTGQRFHYHEASSLITRIDSLDANGAILRTQYNQFDNWGRKTQEVLPSGQVINTFYQRDNSHQGRNNNGMQSVYYTETRAQGSAATREYYDKYGRVIRTRARSFDGNDWQHSDTDYDSLGRAYRTSLPYTQGSARVWATSSFDFLDRVTQINHPDNVQDAKMYYDGFETELRRSGQSTLHRKEIRNAFGEMLEREDAAGIRMRYHYDAAGRLTGTTQAVGTSKQYRIDIGYDLLGRRTHYTDKDLGEVRTSYNNALGEIVTTSNAEQRLRGQQTVQQHDVLGRPIARNTPEHSITWRYATNGSATGQLTRMRQVATANSSQTYQQNYTYTSLGQVASQRTRIDGNQQDHTMQYQYDSLGRLKSLTYPSSSTYPSGYQVSYHYNARGFVERVSDAERVHYQVTQIDALGRVTDDWMGDGSSNQRDYDSYSARLARQYDTNGFGVIQERNYGYDDVGNLTQRNDKVTGFNESYRYDALDRITHLQHGASVTTTYNYDVLSNLTRKSNRGDYTYNHNVRPHAVTRINNNGQISNYQYDANGNQTGDGERNYTWDSDNRLTHLQGSNYQLQFRYSGVSRYKQTKTKNGSTETLYYLAEGHERVINGSTTEDRYAIRMGDRTVAMRIVKSASDNQLRYYHKDHLNSVSVITDGDGQVKERLNYRPFGERQDAKNGQLISQTFSEQPHGFTGHEHLEGGLIHMGGRVFDPKAGRFTSADPFVADPEMSQGWNRYSYVYNNPLRYTDPSGFVALETEYNLRFANMVWRKQRARWVVEGLKQMRLSIIKREEEITKRLNREPLVVEVRLKVTVTRIKASEIGRDVDGDMPANMDCYFCVKPKVEIGDGGRDDQVVAMPKKGSRKGKADKILKQVNVYAGKHIATTERGVALWLDKNIGVHGLELNMEFGAIIKKFGDDSFGFVEVVTQYERGIVQPNLLGNGEMYESSIFRGDVATWHNHPSGKLSVGFSTGDIDSALSRLASSYVSHQDGLSKFDYNIYRAAVLLLKAQYDKKGASSLDYQNALIDFQRATIQSNGEPYVFEILSSR